MKKIYKYATGDIIPEGAVYLGTVTQTHQEVSRQQFDMTVTSCEPCWYVWNYFLIEVSE